MVSISPATESIFDISDDEEEGDKPVRSKRKSELSTVIKRTKKTSKTNASGSLKAVCAASKLGGGGSVPGTIPKKANTVIPCEIEVTGSQDIAEKSNPDNSEELKDMADKSQTSQSLKANFSLTAAQRAKIEQNRQRALLLRHEKINRRTPYGHVEKKKETRKIIRVHDTKLIDTGGGFFIEEDANKEITEQDKEDAMKLVEDPPPLFEDDKPFCLECSHPFDNSYLLHNFDHSVCDQCRDRDDKHMLVTKTDAKNEYLLKDTDFDVREPPLKFIVRKNPHNSRWGDMKLYLKLQVEKRALEVWDSEEALEEALEKRDQQREALKIKKYNKKMKELRMNVRSSLYTRAAKNHEHDYGEEVYSSENDEYSRTCKSCGHAYCYDKM